ncbi:MAG: amidohydrolase family protein [Quisquiliibacterium sp.]
MNTRTDYVPVDLDPHAPKQRFPAGSCDCHFHVFEGAEHFPYSEPRNYTPTPARLEDYRAMVAKLGIERCVLVHPSVYGGDHRSFEKLLSANQGWMRGVAVVRAEHSEQDVARWHALGARGARLNALYAGGAALDDVPAIIERIRPFNWHLQLLIDVGATPELAGRAADMGVTVVLDHFGHLAAARGPRDPGFANLLSLVREGRAWVKVSGAYRVTGTRGDYADVRPLSDALLAANPAQLVWGSDWPHPSIAPPMVKDADLANLLIDWVDPASRQRILVENPARLYWWD